MDQRRSGKAARATLLAAICALAAGAAVLSSSGGGAGTLRVSVSSSGMQGNGMMLIPSDSLVLEERFIPVSADVLQYEVTIDDPKTWTAPWKVSFPLKRDQEYQIFEYACHEGNYAMRNSLSGSRADERAR